MKISKWVDMGAEVDIDIDWNDVNAALLEALGRVASPQFLEEPTRQDVERALNRIGVLLNAFSPECVDLLSPLARQRVMEFLLTAADKFRSKKAAA